MVIDITCPCKTKSRRVRRLEGHNYECLETVVTRIDPPEVTGLGHMPHFGVCGRVFRYIPEEEERYAAMRRERKAREAAERAAAEKERAHQLAVVPQALRASEDPAEIVHLIDVLSEAITPEDYRRAWEKFHISRFRSPDVEIVKVVMRRSLGRHVVRELGLRLPAWTSPDSNAFIDSHGSWWNLYAPKSSLKGKSHFESGRLEVTVGLRPGQVPEFDSWRVEMLRYWVPKNCHIAGGPNAHKAGQTQRVDQIVQVMKDALSRSGSPRDAQAPTAVQCPSCRGFEIELLANGNYRCKSESKIFGANEVRSFIITGARCPSCGSDRMERLPNDTYRCLDEYKLFGNSEVSVSDGQKT